MANPVAAGLSPSATVMNAVPVFPLVMVNVIGESPVVALNRFITDSDDELEVFGRRLSLRAAPT